MATILPTGETTFFDANGDPLALGSVYFYIPSSLSVKDTFQDPGATILNTNPVILDAAGRAVIYGNGAYRQIVKDADGNTIWDQLTGSTTSGGTAWGGESTGTQNAQVINASDFTEEDGQIVGFIAGLTNTGSMTITPSAGSSAVSVLKDTLAGPSPLTGGEVTTGNAVLMVYEQSRGAFHLVEYPQTNGTGALTDLTGGATTNLGTVASQNVNVTGSGYTITSFGSSATTVTPIYYLTFVGTGTITYNATSLITPTAADITVVAGATAIAMYLGSGNWRIIYFAYKNITDIAKIVGTAGAIIFNNGTSFGRLSIGSAGRSLVVDGGTNFPKWDSSITTTAATLTTSGTNIDITGIPSWVKHISIIFSGVSTNGTNVKLIQIGDSGGIETAGYNAGSTFVTGASTSAVTSTSGFVINSVLAADTIYGILSLELQDATNNNWAISGVLSAVNTGVTFQSAGLKSTSATMDRIRLTAGGDTFDGGSITLAYW